MLWKKHLQPGFDSFVVQWGGYTELKAGKWRDIYINMDIGNAKVIFTRFQHALKGCDFFKV